MINYNYIHIDSKRGVEICLILNRPKPCPKCNYHYNNDPNRELLNQADFDSLEVKEAWLWDQGVLKLPSTHRFVKESFQKLMEDI